MEFIPSKYQAAIFAEVKYGSGNIVVDAVPGSGKSKTIEVAIGEVDPGLSVCAIAFNTHIAEAGRKKLPVRFPPAKMYTLHQLGLQAISRSYLCPTGKYPEVEETKVNRLLSEIFKTDYIYLDQETVNAYKPIIRKLVSLYKNLLISKVNEEIIVQLMKEYSIHSETELNIKQLAEISDAVLYQCKIQIATIDYDDMIWYPVVYNLKMPYTYHVIFIDEAQDLNACQMALFMKAVKPGGRVIAVGDTYQAIYHFRGADSDAIPKMIKLLNAKVMPLSITYRCPKKHVEKLKEFVSHIEAAPWAIEGEIISITDKQIVENVKNSDMIICRYVAPLITLAFKLLKAGLKVAIKGRDIGDGLISVIDDLKAANLDEFYEKLKAWKAEKVKKAIQSGKSPETANDTYECLIALADNCDNVWCLKQRINTIFSDNNAAIILSTIHRVKGEEAERVHIFHPELMPSCYASTPKEFEQERHAQYIAYSRSKNILFEVRK